MSYLEKRQLSGARETDPNQGKTRRSVSARILTQGLLILILNLLVIKSM
ncbi:hypothetical protein FOXYSP1_09598 [Fusarium oxysporum f. sp. phaseoli]